MCCWLKREIVINSAGYGNRGDVHGRLAGKGNLDVAGVIGECVIAAPAEIPAINDLPAGSAGGHERTVHFVERNWSAH